MKIASTKYQEQATEFSVGDKVAPFGLLDAHAGRVVAVWPAIGMVDVEFSTGTKRFPVEDLQTFNEDGSSSPTLVQSVPSGAGTVSVPGTRPVQEEDLIKRVATAFEKKSLYWASKDRQYRMSRPEVDSGSPCCPKCGPDYPLKRAIYKRRDNSSERLMGCPGCMFLIKDADIVNFGPVSAEEIEYEKGA